MGLRPFGRRYDTRMYVTEREGRSSVGAKRRTKAEVIGVRLQADGPIGSSRRSSWVAAGWRRGGDRDGGSSLAKDVERFSASPLAPPERWSKHPRQAMAASAPPPRHLRRRRLRRPSWLLSSFPFSQSVSQPFEFG